MERGVVITDRFEREMQGRWERGPRGVSFAWLRGGMAALRRGGRLRAPRSPRS